MEILSMEWGMCCWDIAIRYSHYFPPDKPEKYTEDQTWCIDNRQLVRLFFNFQLIYPRHTTIKNSIKTAPFSGNFSSQL